MLAVLKSSRIHGGNFKAIFEFNGAVNSVKRDKVCAILFNRNGVKLLLYKDDEVEWQ